jgi:hypothetical protein
MKTVMNSQSKTSANAFQASFKLDSDSFSSSITHEDAKID